MKTLPLLCVAALLSASPLCAADLILAENKTSDYQIVLPDEIGEDVIDPWVTFAAKLIQTAFAKNGFELPITREHAKSKDKPGLYLGATQFAKDQGIHVEQLDDWTYYHKVVGKEVIIAGHDQMDPVTASRGQVLPLALLGTVKGVCDFLREYVGVRFLFMNFDEKRNLDSRSIAFLPMEKIALPAQLDLVKKPMMRASYDSSRETLYHIANNFFPRLGSLKGGEVTWYQVLPTAKYAKSNPDFFALTAGGQRACELKLGFDDHMEYCPTHKGAQDLVYAEIEKQILQGTKIIHLSTMDGFRLSRCNCEPCNQLFGIGAKSWDDVHARGRSGKLWQAFFAITERVRAKYPGVRTVLLNYQDTPVSADVIKRFPENIVVNIQFASQRDFDRIAGVEFPAGICGFEETFTGFGQAGPYVPERTPEHMSAVVKAIARNNVKWSSRDGAMGYVRGMQAPAYYVYGRMMDNPDAEWRPLMEEFCTGAFGEMVTPMTQFFDLLHTQMGLYSDFFGVFMPAWDRKYSRSLYHDSKWHVMSIYTPEFMADANHLLQRAESGAKNPDVLARLHLIRIEFDYIRKLSRIFYLQNAWTMNPSQANLDPPMNAIDDWHADLEKLAGGTGRSSFRPLSDWPEMRPFNGHFYTHAALENEGYQQQWNKTCINWDTRAIRAGVLSDKHQLKVAAVENEPVIDSNAWDAAPESFLRVHDGMPFQNISTRMKVLRDKDNLYVRIESLYPSKHPEDFYKRAPDGDILSQEYVELGIAPPNAGGKVFRLAANPVEGSRYDSVNIPGKRDLVEDKKWNGTWKFQFAVTLTKGPYTLADRVWTGWFKIPFSDLGSGPPGGGETWNFNAGRNRNGQSLLWCDAPSATPTKVFGKLEF